LDLKLNEKQLKKVQNGKEIFVLNKDLRINHEGKDIIVLKAGKYTIAKDGKIYFYK
jgi:hypothetical protein